MGPVVTQPFEPFRGAAPPEAASPARPAARAAAVPPASPERSPAPTTCWGCRVLCGAGLLGAGGHVYWAARRPLKLGRPPGPGGVMQMVVGISIACCGVVLLADPKGKSFRFG